MAHWQCARCRRCLPASHFADASITQTARSLGTCAQGTLSLPHDEPNCSTNGASASDLPKKDWEVKVLKHNKTLNKQIILDRFHCVALAGLDLVM